MYREVSGFFFYGSANGQTELSTAGEANVKNMEVFLHLQNRLPDLLDHRNTKLAVFFDGAQHFSKHIPMRFINDVFATTKVILYF